MPKGVRKFLYIIAGGDVRLYDDPGLMDATTTLIGRGASQVAVAAIASISIACASTFFGSDPKGAILIAILWGISILILDAALVRGLRAVKAKMLLSVMLRIFMALLIACVVSFPLEVQIFKGPIERELAQRDLAFSQNLNRELDREFAAAEVVRDRIADRNKTLKPYQDDARELSAEVVTEVAGKSITGREGRGPVFEEKVFARDAAIREFSEAKKQVELENAEDKRKLVILESEREAARKSRMKVQENAHGLADRIGALLALEKSEPQTAIISWIIRLLFITIELSPMLIKLTCKLPLLEKAVEMADKAAEEVYVQKFGIETKSKIQEMAVLSEAKIAATNHLATKAIIASKESELMKLNVVAAGTAYADDAMRAVNESLGRSHQPDSHDSVDETEERLRRLFREHKGQMDDLDARTRRHIDDLGGQHE
ncbi:MAG: DUF4407 domain-containing protein [Chlorobia bacterium]|nr:DUF4407 domain-containing protein [Fimbriimonadaceae bacterium]